MFSKGMHHVVVDLVEKHAHPPHRRRLQVTRRLRTPLARVGPIPRGCRVDAVSPVRRIGKEVPVHPSRPLVPLVRPVRPVRPVRNAVRRGRFDRLRRGRVSRFLFFVVLFQRAQYRADVAGESLMPPPQGGGRKGGGVVGDQGGPRVASYLLVGRIDVVPATAEPLSNGLKIHRRIIRSNGSIGSV